MSVRLTVVLFAALLLLSAATPLAAQPLRAKRPAVSAHFGLGRSLDSGDPAAQALVEGEYALLEHLAVGLGYAYVDGDGMQENCLEVFVKAYLLGRALDLFAVAGAQQYINDGGVLESFLTFRLGVEWQPGDRLLVGSEASVVVEPSFSTDILGGLFVGVRF